MVLVKKLQERMFEEGCMLLWRGLYATLKRVVCYFEEGGMVLWSGLYGTLKRVVWYFEEGGMVLWSGWYGKWCRQKNCKNLCLIYFIIYIVDFLNNVMLFFSEIEQMKKERAAGGGGHASAGDSAGTQPLYIPYIYIFVEDYFYIFFIIIIWNKFRNSCRDWESGWGKQGRNAKENGWGWAKNGSLKRVVWYFEEGGVVLWRGWCGTLKRAVW